MTQRIKGQEVQLGFVGPTGDEDGLQDVQSFEADVMLEVLQEGYLGEVADRFDDIFHGISGKVEIHLETKQYFLFQQRVQDRAQRRSPAGGKFIAKASFDFADGSRARLNFEDIFFEGLPLNVGSRKDYVKATISWKGSTLRRIL